VSKFKQYWARQFGKPEGIGGKIATFIMNRINGAMYKTVIKNAPDTGRILDVGFGNGVLIKKLASKTDSVIYGVDISADMVKNASKRNKKAIKNGRVFLSEGAADNIPFEGSIDFAYTVNTVYFWSDLDAGYKAIADKLTPGGLFLNVCYTKEWLDKLSYTQYGFAKYSPDELKAAAERNGLKADICEIEQGKSYYIKVTK
jgi:SAM-dependent methyltransferase